MPVISDACSPLSDPERFCFQSVLQILGSVFPLLTNSLDGPDLACCSPPPGPPPVHAPNYCHGLLPVLSLSALPAEWSSWKVSQLGCSPCSSPRSTFLVALSTKPKVLAWLTGLPFSGPVLPTSSCPSLLLAPFIQVHWLLFQSWNPPSCA